MFHYKVVSLITIKVFFCGICYDIHSTLNVNHLVRCFTPSAVLPTALIQTGPVTTSVNSTLPDDLNTMVSLIIQEKQI